MNALLHGFAGESISASVRPLSLAVVYEDNDTHRQATAVWEFLLRQLGETADLTATWWRTSLIADPKLSRAAARAVAGSDLILMAIHPQQPLTPALKAWIESWPLSGNQDGKMIALLHERGAMEWDAYLRDWARRKNIVFVDGSAASFTEAAPAPFQANVPSWQTQRRIEPYSHWGLNE